MKKILLVTRPIAPPWDEASKNFAYNLAKNIDNQIFQLHLLTNGTVSELPSSVIQHQIYTHSQNDFDFSQKLRLFWFLLLNAQKFDIIHLLFTPTKSNTSLIKLLFTLSRLNPLTWNSQGAKTIQTVATLREDMFSDSEIKQLMFANTVITYSDYAKNKLQNLNISNVKRIYPGIDLQEYKYKPKYDALLKTFNFYSSDFVIHFSGEYIRLGAMEDVIESFAQVSKTIPNAKLFLAVRVKNEKDATKKKEVVAKLEELKLLEKVAFYDSGEHEMSDIYNLSDISIFPVQNMKGKFDVPLVVIEAMACGKPVIISDLPILKEFATNNNSVIINMGNVTQLTEQIASLHADAMKREMIGKNARAYVEENFDIKSVADKYQEVYEKI